MEGGQKQREKEGEDEGGRDRGEEREEGRVYERGNSELLIVFTSSRIEIPNHKAVCPIFRSSLPPYHG